MLKKCQGLEEKLGRAKNVAKTMQATLERAKDRAPGVDKLELPLS
jgi:hypothetical protein